MLGVVVHHDRVALVCRVGFRDLEITLHQCWRGGRHQREIGARCTRFSERGILLDENWSNIGPVRQHIGFIPVVT
jgi:ABC-type thiamine transport system ATPase subunit